MTETDVRQKGFTFAELLVALFIFAVIASASVFSLRLGVEAREQLIETDRTVKDLQIARTLIREDMAQLRARSVRDDFGDILGAPLHGGDAVRRTNTPEGETVVLAFVRAGKINPNDAAPRSTLEHVEYVLTGNQLIRRAWPYLDAVKKQPTHERVLFETRAGVKIDFLSADQWLTGWPQTGAGGALPQAIRLRMELERFGELQQDFWIGEVRGN